MVLASLAEAISIGTILPFLVALTAPESIYKHEFVQPLIHLLRIQEPKQLVLPLTILFSCAVLISGLLRILLLWMQTRLGHAIGADFSNSVFFRTLYQPYTVHVSRNSSDVIASISNKANGLVYGVALPILTILSSIFILFAVMFALLAIDSFIALTTFAGVGVIYYLIIFVTNNRLAQDSRDISQSTSQVIKALQEGLGGIRDVLIDGTQAIYCSIYQNADSRLRRATANVQIISGTPRYMIEALGMVFIAVVAFSLTNKSDGVVMAIPILGTLAIGAQRLLPLAQQIYSSLAHIKAGRESLIDVLDLLDQPWPASINEPLPVPIRFQQAITIDNISFRYTPDSPLILQGVKLNISKGSRVGFIGTTGSGKSTLLDIIMGLLSPTLGSLIIDHTPITTSNHRSWQMNIAHVPQAIFLADTSIAENIAFGIPASEIDLVRVRNAAKKAQIADVIESWEKQYNTFVGERGIRLSGGQRQRIGIARALYKNANVLIFDEATSALDNETEQALMEAIESLGNDLTILMVAHRISTLKNCTQIVELAEGVVKRVGSYKEIITNFKRHTQ
jgi:ABC-type bacteriocin/lantibiotic exporter with double-glycine peptidase domain